MTAEADASIYAKPKDVNDKSEAPTRRRRLDRPGPTTWWWCLWAQAVILPALLRVGQNFVRLVDPEELFCRAFAFGNIGVIAPRKAPVG